MHSQLSKGATLLALKMALKVFGPLEMLNRSLQARYETVSGMLIAIDETLSGLRDLRDDMAFDHLLAETTHYVAEMDLEELQVPRQRKPPKRYTGSAESHVATTICDYYRPQYFLLIDTAIQQLTDRFHSNSSFFKYQALETLLITGESGVGVGDLSVYEEIDWPDLNIQLELFRRKRSVKCLNDAVVILKGMSPELRGEYSEVEKLVRLLLVSPASSTEAERSFSALRRLKTFLRNTMTQQRLNSLAVCHVHQELLDSIDVAALMQEFVSRNDARACMFGK